MFKKIVSNIMSKLETEPEKENKSPWNRHPEKELSKKAARKMVASIAFKRLLAGNIDELWGVGGKVSSYHEKPLANAYFNVVFLRDDGKIFACLWEDEKKLYKKHKKRWIAWTDTTIKKLGLWTMDSYDPDQEREITVLPELTEAELETLEELFGDKVVKQISKPVS